MGHGHVSRRAIVLGGASSLALALAGCTDDPQPTADAEPPAPDPTSTPEPTPTAPAEPTLLLATLAAEDALAVIDPTVVGGSAIVERVTVGAAPWAVATHAVATDAATAYVTTAEGLAIVDLATRQRTALVPYLHQPAAVQFGEYRDGGLGLAVSPDGSKVFVAVHHWPDPAWLEVLDTATGAFVASVDVGIRPFDVLADPDGAWVATVDHDSYTVTVVDPATLATASHEIAPFGNLGFAGWEKPHYATIAADGRIAVPYQGQVMIMLDPATGATETIETAARTHQHGITTAPDGRLLTSGTGAFGTATGGPSLSILTLPGGSSPAGEVVVPLAHSHETVTVWRPSPDAEWSAVLSGGYTRDGWWDGCTIVGLDSLAVSEIVVPGRAQHIVRMPALA